MKSLEMGEFFHHIFMEFATEKIASAYFPQVYYTAPGLSDA